MSVNHDLEVIINKLFTKSSVDAQKKFFRTTTSKNPQNYFLCSYNEVDVASWQSKDIKGTYWTYIS